jgi:hypothetical protein
MLLIRIKNNGGDNSIDLENTNPNKKAIHIHGGMEHNMAGYAKYYFCGSTKILGGSGFTRKTDHNKRKFSKHW